MPKWFKCDVCFAVYSISTSEYTKHTDSFCTNCATAESVAKAFTGRNIHCLWHMTHVNNVFDIFQAGIFNHYDAHKYKVNLTDISDHNAQSWRENYEPCFNRKIHEYAPLYINPKNPMLYARREIQNNLCFLEVSLSVLSKHEYVITDGNASSRDTRFFKCIDLIPSLNWDVLNAKYWNDFEEGKRKRCAEVLVHPKIEPEYIRMIHCSSDNSLKYISNFTKNVSLSTELYFRAD